MGSLAVLGRQDAGLRPAGLRTALVLCIAVAASGGAPVQQTPAFRSRVEVVRLDVSVLDARRRPVRGLTAEDFTVLENGAPQRIVAFSTFDLDAAPPPAVGWMRDVPPDVTTNALKDSRLFVLVMDDAMIPQQPAFIRDARAIAMSVIDKLEPADLAAVVFTGDNRRTQDFTSDKTRLRAALDRLNPGLAGYRFGSDTGGIDVDMHFYLSAVRTLSDIADYLVAVPNRRKAVFWISPGVPFDLTDAAIRPAPRPDQTGATPIGAAVDMRDLAERTEEIFKRAQRANVTIYPIDPTGLGGMEAFLNQRIPRDRVEPERTAALIRRKVSALQDFLAQSAAATGGRPVMNTNDWEPGITGIFQENQSYYLVGFEPANTNADGTLRRIQVKVNRPDVEVRARSRYYAPEPERPDTRRAAMAPEAAALAKAIGGVVPDAGLPMKVALAPLAVPGQRLATVAIVLGVRQPVPAAAATARITETLELQASAFTPDGDPRGTQRHTARVVLRQGADGEAAYELLGRIDLPAGRYRLRIAAHNAATGTSGSVFADVDVPDYSDLPFSASPVVLSATPGRVSAPREVLASLLPQAPTAEREFVVSDNVAALLRLYQSGQRAVEPVQVAIRIRDARDQVVASDTRTIAAAAFRAAGQDVPPASPLPGAQRPIRALPPQPAPAGDRFASLSLRTAEVRFQLPLAKLTPGPHLLTFEATIGATVLRRDVRFDVK